MLRAVRFRGLSVFRPPRALRGGHYLNVTADDLFPDLLDRVDAVQRMTDAPLTLAVKIARLRRALPDPARHLEVRELFEVELARLHHSLAARTAPFSNSGEELDTDLDALAAGIGPLLELFVTGIQLDRDRQHTKLWVWVLQQAMNARHAPAGAHVGWWDALVHYPAVWGPVRERRFRLRSGLVVELGIAPLSWASVPLDSGTRRVLSDGYEIVYDTGPSKRFRTSCGRG